MQQEYLEAKARHPGMLLLFRCGDFYELFDEDAETAAKSVGLTLTTRQRGSRRSMMAGFPCHALESYLRKLLSAGHRVAICDTGDEPNDPPAASISDSTPRLLF